MYLAECCVGLAADEVVRTWLQTCGERRGLPGGAVLRRRRLRRGKMRPRSLRRRLWTQAERKNCAYWEYIRREEGHLARMKLGFQAGGRAFGGHRVWIRGLGARRRCGKMAPAAALIGSAERLGADFGHCWRLYFCVSF